MRPVRYADPTYWDERYSRQQERFDWFYGYSQLRRLIRAYAKKRWPLLHVGCGNSDLQEGLAEDGYHVVNIDISPVVISKMRELHSHLPSITYEIADVRALHGYAGGSFATVLDKGTLDALVCCKESDANADGMISEIYRVLQPNGVLLLLTLGDPAHRLHYLLKPVYEWEITLCLLPRPPAQRCNKTEGVEDRLDILGPYPLHESGQADIPEKVDPQQYFFCYICRKRPLALSLSKKDKLQLPEGWRQRVSETVSRMRRDGKLKYDPLAKGIRVRTVRESALLAELQANTVAPGEHIDMNVSMSLSTEGQECMLPCPYQTDLHKNRLAAMQAAGTELLACDSALDEA